MAAIDSCGRSVWPRLPSEFLHSRSTPPRASSTVAILSPAAGDGRFYTAFAAVNPQDLPSSSGREGALLVLREHGPPRRSWHLVVSTRKPGRRQRMALCTANLRAQEEAATVKEIADLSESLLSLKGVVSSEYRAIGPEMRDRVDRLYDRVLILQQSADRATTSGTRFPTQLTANLIALQREHGSLENIVRLAMEAGPALASLEAAVGRSNALSDAVSNLLLEEAKPKAVAFQSLIRESAVEPLKRPPKYVMSAPASRGSSPLAAFRAEIERRVIEQLAGKKMDNPVISNPADLSLLPSETESRPSHELLVEKQSREELSEPREDSKVAATAASAAEVAGTATFLENKLKQLELELAKSIPLQVFEQTVSKINTSLSDARAKVVQLTAEALEKEAILADVKKDLLTEKELLMQKVRELTGDLEKKFSVDDMEAAVNFGLEEVERELEEEQDRAFRLSIELEKSQKSLAEQQENWRIMKEEMEKRLEDEQIRTQSLSSELEGKQKSMIDLEEAWKLQRSGLESELKSVKEKMQEVRKKRTKERAELADKKKKVKSLEQELARVQNSMDEADRMRLKKKESMYATVRMLISQMVQSARARAESEAQASTLVCEVAKLQEEKRALELTKRAAEEKVGLAEAEVEGMKSNLTKVGQEVANLQGELLSGERVASLEKFFAIMAHLIKQESEVIEESSPVSLESDYRLEDEDEESNETDTLGDGNVVPSEDDGGQEVVKRMVMLQTETNRE